MPGVSLEFSTAAGDEIGKAFANLQGFYGDMRPVWPNVLGVVRRQLLDSFRTEGGSGRDGRWAPLSEPYRTRKALRFPGTKTLERTGRLRESLVRDGGDAIVIEDPRFLFVGSRVPYAGFHQEGTSRMPRRPIYSPTLRDAAEWVAEIHKYFDRNVFKGTGGGQRVSVKRALVGA